VQETRGAREIAKAATASDGEVHDGGDDVDLAARRALRSLWRKFHLGCLEAPVRDFVLAA